jgi:hypothetical protein
VAGRAVGDDRAVLDLERRRVADLPVGEVFPVEERRPARFGLGRRLEEYRKKHCQELDAHGHSAEAYHSS